MPKLLAKQRLLTGKEDLFLLTFYSYQPVYKNIYLESHVSIVRYPSIPNSKTGALITGLLNIDLTAIKFWVKKNSLYGHFQSLKVYKFTSRVSKPFHILKTQVLIITNIIFKNGPANADPVKANLKIILN